MSEAKIYSDGAARGNPGPAGVGAVILDAGDKVLAEVCKYMGEMTNNQAEYHALLLALAEARKLNITRVFIYADSELMVRQLRGEYKVKNDGLKSLFQEAQTLLRKFGGYTIDYIPREKNKRADKLANLAIDGQVL